MTHSLSSRRDDWGGWKSPGFFLSLFFSLVDLNSSPDFDFSSLEASRRHHLNVKAPTSDELLQKPDAWVSRRWKLWCTSSWWSCRPKFAARGKGSKMTFMLKQSSSHPLLLRHCSVLKPEDATQVFVCIANVWSGLHKLYDWWATVSCNIQQKVPKQKQMNEMFRGPISKKNWTCRRYSFTSIEYQQHYNKVCLWSLK